MGQVSIERTKSRSMISCTRIFVGIMGVLAGFGGMGHGVAEVLQGNKTTGGMLLSDIGAFTIIPNYLYTGIAVIIISAAVMAWTLLAIHRKNGPDVFFALCTALFLTGGGIAQAVFFLLTWAVAIRINNPPDLWKKDGTGSKRKKISGFWPVFIVTAFAVLTAAMMIWIFLTPPGTVQKPQAVQYTIWSLLALSLVLIVLTVVSGFARDMENGITSN
jgi:hypothetical protein